MSLAARCAEALFRSPPRPIPTPGERRVLDSGEKLRVRCGAREVAVWRWRGGARSVLLVHGWGGHAGRMAAFVPPLLEAGLSVVAFDAPAHGRSSGRRGSLPDFGQAILAVEREFGPFTAVIGHSMGAAGAALAMRDGFAPARAVFIAPPADPEEFSERFSRALKLPAAVRDGMKRRLERRYATRWSEVKLVACVPDRPVPLLIFHDAGDRAVPLRDKGAILLAWRGATIVRTRGLGHSKILRDAAVVRASVSFVLPAVREARAGA